MKKVLFILIFCFALSGLKAQTTLMSNLWDTDGEIYDSEIIGNNIYLAGKFKKVLPITGPAALINTVDGNVLINGQINVDGEIRAISPDGQGGYYIGGDFTTVNGNPRNNIFQIDAQRNLTSFSPNVQGEVNELFFDNGKLILKGFFYRINNQDLNRFAVYYTASGVFNQTFTSDNSVNTFIADGRNFTVNNGFLYFYTYSTGSKLCRFQLYSAFPTIEQLPLSTYGTISDLIFRNDTAFIFGGFTQIGTALRNNTAAINTSNFQVLPWYPNANGNIYSAAIDGNKMFVSGSFTSIGGRPCTKIAAINIQTSLAFEWYPEITNIDANNRTINSSVSKVLVDNGKLYVGGDFSNISTLYRSNFARFNTFDLTLDNWFSLADASVQLIEKTGDHLLVSGRFNKIGGKLRSGFACLNLESGTVQPITANLDGDGTDIINAGNNEIFVSGKFGTVNGQSRNRVAKLNITNGLLLPFNTNAPLNFGADKLEIGTFLYIFSERGLTAVDKDTGNTTGWRLQPTSAPGGAIGSYSRGILTAKELNSKLYVGGYFGSINNEQINNLASFEVNNQQKTSWNPQPNDQVTDIEVYNGKLIVAGEFFDIGFRPRNYFAELDPNSDIATNMVANANSPVTDIAINNNLLYLLGNFTIFADAAFSNNIGTFDLISQRPATWRSEVNFNSVFNVSSANNVVAITRRNPDNWVVSKRYLQVFRNDLDIALDTKKPELNAEVSIYPNPSTGKISLQLPSSNLGSSGKISFYSLNGVLSQTLNFKANETELNIGTFAPGLYMYTITLANGKQFSGKIQKQ